MGLLPALIEPSLQHEEASTRRIGLECLGLYCLLREETAKNYLPLLNQVIRVDEESVKEAAFQVYPALWRFETHTHYFKCEGDI